MRKKLTKAQMAGMLTGVGNHLTEHSGDFPGIAMAIVALHDAAKNLGQGGVKAETKTEKKTPTVNDVSITYSGTDLLVKAPWGAAGKVLADAFKVIVGKQSKTTNPATGEPFFLTVFDKKAKAHRIPKDKEVEVRAAIKASGLLVAS